MAILSDNIEEFIKSLLGEYDKIVDLQRNELADYFSCAPSQINYVLATRFSPEKGYLIESRRGGGGYIRLVRINPAKQEHLSQLISSKLGEDKISEKDAETLVGNLLTMGFLDPKTAKVLFAVVSNKAINIPSGIKDRIRASILKEALTALLGEE